MIKPMPWSRRQTLLNLPATSFVKVWTLQHVQAVEQAKSRGWFSGEHEYKYLREENEQDMQQFIIAYEWMREQMAIMIPNHSGDLPVWGWPKRPSRKMHRSYKDCLRITALVPRSRILLSSFDAWHMPLNNAPILTDELEWDKYDKGNMKYHAPDTWHEIFNLNPRTGRTAQWMGQPDVVQLCIDRIYWNEIIQIKNLTP